MSQLCPLKIDEENFIESSDNLDGNNSSNNNSSYKNLENTKNSTIE